MFKRIAVACLSFVLAGQSVADTLPKMARVEPAPSQQGDDSARKLMSDAAIIAALIAGSIALYRASSGGNCACDYHLKSDGARCGKNSAHYRRNGYNPLCSAADVTASMIEQYRFNGALPPIR